MKLPATLRLVALAVVAALPGSARAQCADWTPGYYVAGIDGTVFALAVFDDGSGSGDELYAGGQFQAAGDVLVSNIAKWNGTRWAPVGAGRPGVVRSFCVWDDGSGSALYAGLNRPEGYVPPSGSLTTIAKWNGSSWIGLPGGIDLGAGVVKTMTVHDDGSGRALYIGGYFHPNSPDWPRARSVARFDGTTWSPVGNGFYNSTFGVEALTSFDDGSGAKLYAGGQFLRTVPGSVAGPVARFDGTQWGLYGSGLSDVYSDVRAFARFGPGAGSLYAAGDNLLGLWSNPLVRLAAGTWSPVGGELIGEVDSLLFASTPQGERLFAAGTLYQAGPETVRGIAAFDGSAWQALATGTSTKMGPLALYDAGTGAQLVAGGGVSIASGPDAVGIARYDGSTWSTLGPGIESLPRPYHDLATFDDGQGAALYAGSDSGLLRRVGDQWVQVGGSMTRPVLALAVHDDGVHGAALHAAVGAVAINGRRVTQVLRWNGATWTALGVGLAFGNLNWNPTVYDLVSFDDGSGPRLVAVGDFDLADDQYMPFVAAWDGQAWTPLDTGFDNVVLDAEVFDDGTGPALYAAGVFTSSRGNVLNGLARWNGAQWVSAGPGAPPAQVLRACDHGSGPRLYAGRRSSLLGLTYGLSVFDGTSWNSLATGPVVNDLAVHDDGSGAGARLVVAGSFTAIGGVAATNIARFDGAQWSALGGGLVTSPYGSAQDLAVHDDGRGAALFVLGDFQVSGAYPAYRFARYGPTGAAGCVLTTGSVTCAGDGGGAACPCGNVGGADRGCGNSANANGAVLVAEGQAHRSADTVTLRATGMTPGGAALFFQGTQSVAAGAGIAFGDGVRCVSGSQVRLAIRGVSGGVASFGDAVAGDASVSSAGQLPLGASTRYYQVWYRDAQSFCTSSTFNLTNGLRLLWAP